MKYSKATNYALHTMLFLVAHTPDKPIGVQQLAERQNVSPTYLSKILTKLVKAGLIESTSGANGGTACGARGRDLLPGYHPCHRRHGLAVRLHPGPSQRVPDPAGDGQGRGADGGLSAE